MRIFALALFLVVLHLVPSPKLFAQDSASEDYEKALQSFYEENIDEAYIHLKNALQKDPAHLPSKILMGETLLSNGNTQEAVIELQEALEFGADVNLTTVPLAQAYLILENYEGILEFSEQRLDADKKFELQLLKANAYHNLEQSQRALSIYQSALSSRPNSIRAINSLASYFLLEQRLDEDEEMLTQSQQINSNAPRTLHLLGQLAKARGDNALAFTYFERAYKGDSADPLIKRSVASAYMDRRDYAAARRVVEEILEQTPDDPFAMLLNGRLLSLDNENELANSAFEELSQKLTLVPDEVKSKRPDLLFVTAMASYLSENYEKASRELQAYLLKAPSNLNALGVLADTYLKLDQVSQAETLLDRQRRTVATNLGLGLVLCDLYLETGKNYKCDSLLEQLKNIHGDNNSIAFMQIEALQARQRYSDALKLFEERFPNPTGEDLIYASANLYLQNSQPQKALDRINQLIAERPDDIIYKLQKSDILLSMGDTVSARPIVENLLAKNPRSFAGRLNLVRILLTEQQFSQAEDLANDLSLEVPTNVAALILLGRAFIAQNKYEQALQRLGKAKDLAKDDPRPSELIAQVYIAQNNLDSALLEFNDLSKSNFLNPDYVLAKAQIYLQQRDFVNASKHLNVLFGIWTDQPQNLLFLSQLQSEANDTDNALRSLEKAMQLAPSETAIQLEMVRLRLARNEFQLAKQVSEELLAKNSNNPNVSLLAGEVAMALNDIQAAHKHYLDAFKLDNTYQLAAAKLYQLATKGIGEATFTQSIIALLKDNPKYYFQRNLLGDYYMGKGQYDSAKQAYEQLISVPNIPNKQNIFNNLANIVMEVNLELANQYIDKALKIEAQSSALIDTKGWILTKQFQYSEALTFLRRAFALDSSDPSIRYHLAYTLHKLGRINEARKELDAALASERTFNERPDAVALMMEIESTPS